MKTAAEQTTTVQRATTPTRSFFSQAASGTSFFAPTLIQPQLTINEPGDAYEQEADAMAERVMRMPFGAAGSSLPVGGSTLQRQPFGISRLQRQELPEEDVLQSKPLFLQRKCAACEEENQVQTKLQSPLPSNLQRKCASCAAEEQDSLQTMPLLRKATGGGYTAPPQLSTQLSQSKGGGQPLSPGVHSWMSTAFGADFSGVRVHTDPQAQAMSQSIQAKAFTHGNDVYFNRGEYNPESGEGRKLLAHELTHVVQQGGGSLTIQKAHICENNVELGKQVLGDDCEIANSNELKINKEIPFKIESDYITQEEKEFILYEIIEPWKEAGGNIPIEVNGYASCDGSEEFNWILSCKRANALADFLEDEGVSQAFIRTFANGETNLFSSTSLGENRKATISTGSSPKNAETVDDHYIVELKAWIPHSKVVDPEEQIRLSNLLDIWMGTVPSIVDMEYESFYRGDNHIDYPGAFRVISIAEFDFNGIMITNFMHTGEYGTTHRDYSFTVFIDNGWPIPNVPFKSVRASESDTATSATNGDKLSLNSFTLGIASTNPLIITWAPDISSNLSVMILNTSDGNHQLDLSYRTDSFPSHGIRILKNGSIIDEKIILDASGKYVLGPIGANIILHGLSFQNNYGSYMVRT